MSNGANKDYTFGIKSNWRRTIHNRFVDYLVRPPKESVVLYLPGPKDLDRPEFLRRRFRPENLVAIERDKTTAKQLRASGVLCINGDLIETIKTWVNDPISVLLADFCCGLQITFTEMIESLVLNPCFDNSVVVVNMLRGRDASSNQLRAIFTPSKGEKHRGKILAEIYKATLLNACDEYCVIEEKENCFDELVDSRIREIIAGIKTMPIDHYEYKSGALTFDSIVFRNVTPWGIMDRANEDTLREKIKADLLNSTSELFKSRSEEYKINNLLNPDAWDGFDKNLLQAQKHAIQFAEQEMKLSIDAESSRCHREGMVSFVRSRQKIDRKNKLARQIAAVKAVRSMRLK